MLTDASPVARNVFRRLPRETRDWPRCAETPEPRSLPSRSSNSPLSLCDLALDLRHDETAFRERDRAGHALQKEQLVERVRLCTENADRLPPCLHARRILVDERVVTVDSHGRVAQLESSSAGIRTSSSLAAAPLPRASLPHRRRRSRSRRSPVSLTSVS